MKTITFEQVREKQSTKLLALKKQIETGAMKSHMAWILAYFIDHGRAAVPDIEHHMESRHPVKNSSVTSAIARFQDWGIIRPTAKAVISDGYRHRIYEYVEDEKTRDWLSWNRRMEKYNAMKRRMNTEFGDFVRAEQMELNL